MIIKTLSIHTLQKVPPPILWRTLPPPFPIQILSNPNPSPFLPTSTPIALFVALFLCFFDWIGDSATFDHIWQVYWDLTHDPPNHPCTPTPTHLSTHTHPHTLTNIHIHTHTYTHTHTHPHTFKDAKHTQWPIHRHAYINIY